MTGNSVNGSGNGARSGAQTLALLAAPLNVLIVRALADGPKQFAHLQHAAGSPAQTTLRAQLKRLAETGAIEKRRRDRFPGVLEYLLTPPGRELLFVVDVLEAWLNDSPEGPLPLASRPAKAAIKALADGWSTTMLRALAAGPLSLTELDGVIGSFSYPSLERRLAAMRLAGQIEARRGIGRGTPYSVTTWLRRGLAPVTAAARWERRHMPKATAPITGLDAEAALLLPMPLLQLPAELTGSCRLAVDVRGGKARRVVGVMIEAKGGAVVSCATHLQGSPDAWAFGSATEWLDAITRGGSKPLELGGDSRLARALLDGLHAALFPVRS